MNIKHMKIIYRLFYSTTLFLLLIPKTMYAGDTYVDTPEGRPVPADTPQEMPDWLIAYLDSMIQNDWIDNPPYLNAVRIGNSSNTHNCHGYAWSISEGGPTVWIGTIEDPDVEVYYWTDGAWSNDSQPSYSSSSESVATHAWYNPGDHSVRKIQNSYPRPISGGRDYVSKWGYYGLYQHQKGHDIYRKKSTEGFDFKKLKTTHYGTLSNYDKTWVGAGGQSHSITGSVTVPSGVTLTIMDRATVNNADITVQSGGKMSVKLGVTFNMTSNDGISCYGQLQVQGNSSNKVRFQKSGYYNWDHIAIIGPGTGISYINYAIVSNAHYGIFAEATPYFHMTDVTIENNDNYGLQVHDTDDTHDT